MYRMASLNGKKLWELRVVDLRAELGKRGLNESGLKSELVDRLEKSIFEEATDLVLNEVFEASQTFQELAQTKNLTALVSNEVSEAQEASLSTINQGSCKDCNDFSIEMAEVKLELAMLWALVNTKQTTSLKNTGTQTVYFSKKQPKPDVSSHGQGGLGCSNDISKSRADFENQLKSYRLANKEKFVKHNGRQNQIQIQNQAKTSKTSRKQKGPQNNELAAVKQRLRETEEEKKSLRTAVEILKNEFIQALNTKEDKENHCPWQVIKPKSTIDIRNKNKSKLAKSASQTNQQTKETAQLSTANQYSVLKDQLRPAVINVDEEEHNTTVVSDYVDKSSTTNKIKPANKSKKSSDNKERDNNATVVIGDSLLKGLRQHSIAKATKSKVQVKCFPGANLQDMKHYSIPALSAKPKHIILHCGTNDLHSKKPEEIINETGELCNYLQKKNPDADITISSIITRKGSQENKVAEVNDLLKLLCIENDFRFLVHQNIDFSCLNSSGLHLNKVGDSIFAKNIIETIKCF